MSYITIKRARFNSISGLVNLPYGTEIQQEAGILYLKGAPLCGDKSQNAYQLFAVNDDGNGLIRGRLTQVIQKSLAKRDNDYQKRWDKIWNDKLCQKYKRSEYEDYWLWNHDFYNADIKDLQYIASLIGAKI